MLFAPEPAIDPGALIMMIQREPTTYRFDGKRTLRITREFAEPAEAHAFLDALLDELAPSDVRGDIAPGRAGDRGVSGHGNRNGKGAGRGSTRGRAGAKRPPGERTGGKLGPNSDRTSPETPSA